MDCNTNLNCTERKQTNKLVAGSNTVLTLSSFFGFDFGLCETDGAEEYRRKERKTLDGRARSNQGRTLELNLTFNSIFAPDLLCLICVKYR